MGIKRGVPRSWRIASTASFLSRFPLLRVPLFCLDTPTFTSLLHLFVFGWWSFNGAFEHSFESGFPAIFCSSIVSICSSFFFSVFLFLFLFVSISVSCELVIGCIFFYWLFAKKVLCELIEGLGRNRFGRFFCFLLPLFYGNLDWGRIGGFILPFLTILCELIGIKKVSFVFFFSLFGLFLGTLFFFLYLFVVFFPSFSELI